MTIGDAILRIKDRSHRGDVNVTTDTITAQIMRALNDSRREVIKLLPEQWLRVATTFPTVIGQQLYDLPSDCQEPTLFRYVYNNADYFLNKVESEREFYADLWGTTVTNNLPLFFVDMGIDQSTNVRQIQLFPTPAYVLTIDMVYMKDPTVSDMLLSQINSAIPDIPNYCHDVVWKGGLYHFLKCFDDPLQQIAKADYDASKMDVEIANDRDLDSDLQFRLDVGRRITDFRSPGTGIRLR